MQTKPFPYLTFCLMLPFFCGSMAAAVWVPFAWMTEIVPMQKAQRIFMENQARIVFWQQSEETLRHNVAPARFAEHLPGDFAAEYSELYKKYRQKMWDQYEKFSENKPALRYEVYKYHRYPWYGSAAPPRFYYVLWGLTITSLLSGYCLFRLRRSENNSMLFLTSLIALLSSGILMVLPVFYCWLRRALNGQPDFIEAMSDLWAVFVCFGLAGYLYAVILTFTILFVPKRKHVFHRLRALTALTLVLLSGLLGGMGYVLISSASVGLDCWAAYFIIRKDEMPKRLTIYQQFGEDYQLLLTKYNIELSFDPKLVRVYTSELESLLRGQPMVSYVRLAVSLRQPDRDIISTEDLSEWHPPQQDITQPATMGGVFIFAVTILFGIPGLMFAVLHVVWLKHVIPRKGLILANAAILLFPVLLTITSAVCFVIVAAWMIGGGRFHDDGFVCLFVALIGAAGISAWIYFVWRYLKHTA